jgi:hypothetical protein
MTRMNQNALRMAVLLASFVAANQASAWVHASGGYSGGSSSHWGGSGSYGSSSSYRSGNTSYGEASNTRTGAYGGTMTKSAAGSVTTNPNGSKSYSGGEQTTYTAPDGQSASTNKTTNGYAYNGTTSAYHATTGSTSNGAYYGSSHTTYGTTTGTAYHSTYYGTTAYPAYHPPTTVNYYGSSCYNCGGWSAAGAAAAGLAVGVVAGAAIASNNTAVATSNAYSAGVATGSANTTAAYNAGVVAGATGFAMGTIYATLPTGTITTNVAGQVYYLNGNTWFQPSYVANGVYYRVVAAP